jgi:hypothetical protein
VATIVSENVALAITKLVSSRVLPALVSNLVMGNIVNRDYEGTEFSVGNVVNIPIAPPLAANNIAETGTVTGQAVSLGNAQVTLNSHVESSFIIPDVTRVLTNVNLIDLYANSAMIALAEKIESDLFSLYVNFQETAGANNAAKPAASSTAAAESCSSRRGVPSERSAQRPNQGSSTASRPRTANSSAPKAASGTPKCVA